jgi:hypothetical protein
VPKLDNGTVSSAGMTQRLSKKKHLSGFDCQKGVMCFLLAITFHLPTPQNKKYLLSLDCFLLPIAFSDVKDFFWVK